MSRSKPSTKPIAVRVDTDIVEKLDALAVRLENERPGIKVSRSDAVRYVLTRSLSAEFQLVPLDFHGEQQSGDDPPISTT